MVSEPADSRAPVRRLVILGASNVARAAAVIVEEGRRAGNGPLDVMLAMGHGRSYGLTTSAPLRTLPAILDCGLWDALAEAPAIPTRAIITDIGNDIIYGMSPTKLLAWIEECRARLSSIAERIAITSPPLAAIARLSKFRFYALRSVLFPRSPLRFAQAKPFALELDAAIRNFAQQESLQLFEPRAHWYGWDPIHIRFARQREAWNEMLRALWSDRAHEFMSAAHAYSRWKIHAARPHRSLYLGRAREIAQPSLILHDGTRVSFY